MAENIKSKKKKKLGRFLMMTMDKLADEIAERERVPLDKAKEKAEEIILDHKKWSPELVKDMLTFSLVDKEKISFDVAKEKAEKIILAGKKQAKEMIAIVKYVAGVLSKQKNVTFNEAEKMIWDYLEKKAMRGGFKEQ